MPTLIAYASKYGATKEAAERLSLAMGSVPCIDVTAHPTVDLAPYDTVILGTSVYASRPRKGMRNFTKKYEKTLAGKRLGLFLCCMQDSEKSLTAQMNVSFPKALTEKAEAMAALGGRVDYKKLNPLEGIIMRLITGDKAQRVEGKQIDTLSQERIERFASIFR